MQKNEIIVSVEENDKGLRLDYFISENYENLSRTYIQKLIDNENIIIKDTNKKIKSSYKLRGNEEIIVKIPEDEELNVIAEDIEIDIVYEDSDILLINKNPYVVVHPAPGNYTGTLVNAILYHVKDLSRINGVLRPGIVHRLDKNTSGLIIVAKNDKVHSILIDMFKDKKIKKTYLAIVKGKLKNKEERLETLIGRNPNDRKQMTVVGGNGKEAITNYKVLDENNNYSLLKINIETGRTHQIRVHMKYINHPILGDEVYGNSSEEFPRQMLHAYSLEFKHPLKNQDMKLIAELKEDFVKALNKTNLKFDKEKF